MDFSKAGSDLRLLIIVVTFNSEHDIEACIHSISENISEFGGVGHTAVCVVDNGSTDKTCEILERLAREHSWLQLQLLETNLGFGNANNLAMHSISADAYFLLNADARMLGDSITPALDRLNQSDHVGVIGLPLVYPDGRPQTYSYVFSSWHRWLLVIVGARRLAYMFLAIPVLRKILKMIPYGLNFTRTHGEEAVNVEDSLSLKKFATLSVRRVDWVSGAAMLLSADFIRASGGFDPNIFLYGEDEDLCLVAHRLNYIVETLGTVPIVHKLGWNGKIFRPTTAHMKYESLLYFINKNIQRKYDRILMLTLLPFYVYGWRSFRYISKIIQSTWRPK